MPRPDAIAAQAAAEPSPRRHRPRTPGVDRELLAQVIAINPAVQQYIEPKAVAAPTAPANSANVTGMRAAVAGIVDSQNRTLQNRLEAIAAQRAKLDAEEQQIVATTAANFSAVIAVLDGEALRKEGQEIFATHRAFLARLGLTAAQLLAAKKP